MPPELIEGRDIELLVIGTACLIASWWYGLNGGANWKQLVIFAILAALSFGLALWDIRTRGEVSVPRAD